MKKNWMQYLTLALCFVLLFLCIAQTARLETLRFQLVQEIAHLENELSNAINAISYDLRRELEEAAEPVEFYEVNLAEIDYESRSISLDVLVTLKQWGKDTTVSLITTSADEKNIQHMLHDGTGTFTGKITAPLEATDGFWLEAMVSTGGVSTTMELTGYPDLASLMPLYSVGCAWSGLTYSKGTLPLEFEQHLEWQYESGTISNARFEIHVNDELFQTVNANEANNLNFQLPAMVLECEENDTIQLYFRCDDSFGLSYRFHCLEIVIEDGNVVESISDDEMEFFWISEAENCDH